MAASTAHTASDAVQLVLAQAQGLRCYLTGSAAAAADKASAGIPGFEHAYSDVDLFVGAENEWIRSIQYLVDSGYTFAPRMDMLWQRILHYGTHGWQTNSMRLFNPEGIEVNLIYKTVGRHPTPSLSQVIETFDFGLLSVGWETETGTFRDARSYQFPTLAPHGPLPLLPWRRESTVNGHFREHQGLRTFGRAARYFHTYGYDGSFVVPDLVQGYQNAALYLSDRTDEAKRELGLMYQKIALLLDDRDWPALIEAAEIVPKMDTIDELFTYLIEA